MPTNEEGRGGGRRGRKKSKYDLVNMKVWGWVKQKAEYVAARRGYVSPADYIGELIGDIVTQHSDDEHGKESIEDAERAQKESQQAGGGKPSASGKKAGKRGS